MGLLPVMVASRIGVVLGDDAADLHVHDGVPSETKLLEDGVAVLVEFRGPPGHRGFLAELDRSRGQN